MTATASATKPHESPPTITLAGQEWPVPVLAPKQNRVIVPALLDIIPKIIRAHEDGGGDLVKMARYLDTPMYDRLSEVAFLALSRGHPALTRDEFDDMPIATEELVGIVRTVAQQAGLMRSVPVATKAE